MRIAFGLLDVGGDGVIGRRDVFAALAATRFEEGPEIVRIDYRSCFMLFSIGYFRDTYNGD